MNLNLVSNVTGDVVRTDDTAIPDAAQSHLDMTAYQSVVYPLKQDVRCSKMNNLLKSVEPDWLNNEHNYKLFTMNIIAFKHSLHGNGRANFVLPKSAKPALNVPVTAPINEAEVPTILT